MFHAIDISTSGLVAQRQRMNTIAGNVANASTTRDADGNAVPFQRRMVTFSAKDPDSNSDRGVGVTYRVQTDTATPPRRVYQPGHPDADPDGYVTYPNVNLVTEFVNAVEASRAYEANVTAIEISKEMAQLGLKILA